MINKQSYESVGTERFSFHGRKPINGDNTVSDNSHKPVYESTQAYVPVTSLGYMQECQRIIRFQPALAFHTVSNQDNKWLFLY